MLKITGLLLTLALLPSIALAEETAFRAVGAMNFNGESNDLFVRGAGKWGAPNCPNATYVQVKPNVAGRKEILAMVLSAKSMGRQIQFWGNCEVDKDLFSAFYVVIE